MTTSLQMNVINIQATVRSALKQLNSLSETTYRTLFVVDGNNKLVGTITDGDIRRGFLKDLNLTDTVENCMSKDFKFLLNSEDKFEKIKTYRQMDIGMVPILDPDGHIVEIADLSKLTNILPITALIMAGGRGERLKPLTINTPKPMLMIDNKPILQYNIERLKKFGIKNIIISVNYLSEKIIEYFGDGNAFDVSIMYVKEEAPLGTLGALSLIPDIEHEHILVINSDILTDIDYQSFFECYLAHESNMCVASIPYHVQVPYAVLEVTGQKIVSFVEKPNYNYYSNGGMYIIHKPLKDVIPFNQHFNTTDLMDNLIRKGEILTHYPHLGYWLDIGQHNDYLKAQEDIKRIHL